MKLLALTMLLVLLVSNASAQSSGWNVTGTPWGVYSGPPQGYYDGYTGAYYQPQPMYYTPYGPIYAQTYGAVYTRPSYYSPYGYSGGYYSETAAEIRGLRDDLRMREIMR